MGREDELAMLDNAWLDPKTNIVEFVAFGGVGKSALVAEWLKRMQADEYRGAVRVFGHSFYSQGSREDAQASADSFLDQALRFFGDPDPTEGSPWDKGERLARLVRQQPTLLILDGVEPLQSPETTDDAGQVRDPGLQALIVELAARNTGLIVISTRARIKDIEGHENSSVVSHSLDFLSIHAGTALLKAIGVTGTDEELGMAVEEVGGHALSVTLVGKYVCNAASGHIQDRFEIGLPRVDLVPAKPNENDENPLEMAVTPDLNEIGKTLVPDAGERRNRSHVAKTFSRIMQRYEVWLSGLQDREGDVEVSGRMALEIARLTGLFDRPITAGEFAALVGNYDEEAHTKARRHKEEDENLRAFVPSRENPPIPGLTDRAGEASEGEVNLAIGRLVEYGLITKVTGSRIRLSVPPWPNKSASEVVLDAHPLVREFFAKRLAQGEQGSEGDESMDSPSPALGVSPSVREAHRRLYEHLKQSAPERPDNLSDMMPLYHAVAHGCNAGLWQETLDEVYYLRILRGEEYYSMKKLGVFGTDLAAVSNFFETAWTVPNTAITTEDQGFVLGVSGFDLRGVGRLLESEQPIKAAIQERIGRNDWKYAAVNANNLSELSLTLGDVSSAVRQGEQSVELADRSGNAFQRMAKRTTLAAALFGAGVTRLPGDREREPNAFASGLSASPRETPAASVVGSPAHLAFREAEAIWQQDTGREYLWSTPGFKFCELLLENAATLDECRAIRARAATTLDWVLEERRDIISAALDHLTLGRTWQLPARLESDRSSGHPPSSPVASSEQEPSEAGPDREIPVVAESPYSQAEHHLSQSVTLLRQAGTQHHLPRGLLHRAALWREMLEGPVPTGRNSDKDSDAASADERPVGTSPTDYLANAERDLSEAESIAERGSMLIWQIEAALERTRLYLLLATRESLAETQSRGEEETTSGTLRLSGSACDKTNLQLAREKLDETKALIKQTEKPYEPYEPMNEIWKDADKTWEPPSYIGVFKKGEIVGYHWRNVEIKMLEEKIDRL